MHKPVCLFVKIEAPSYSSIGMEDGFRSAGYDLVSIDWQRIRFSLGIDALRMHLISQAQSIRPALMFLHIQLEGIIDVECAKELMKYCGAVVNFSEDVRDPLPEWYVSVGKEITLTVMTNKEDVLNLRGLGVRATYMNTSYNHLWYKPQPKSLNKTGEIVFIGNNYMNTNLKFPLAQERYDMVRILEKEFGERFKVYGMNWGAYTAPINPQKAVEVINNAEIVISHSNFDRWGYTSDRMFNIIGCNSFILPKHYKGIEVDFSLHTWSDLENLPYLVDYYLLREKARRRQCENSYDQCLSYHQWKHRFKKLTSQING